jgi:hypothetical protein
MVFKIHTRGFNLMAALANAVETRLQAVTKSWGDQLTRVDITLSDANGPRGGALTRFARFAAIKLAVMK